MLQLRNLSGLAMAAMIMLVLVEYQDAIAQEAPKVAVKIDATENSGMARVVAYKTLNTFVPWLLARAERMTVIGEAERQAIFRAFAEQQLWRTSIAAGDGVEG